MLLATLLIGCRAGDYRRSADRDVADLLRQRKAATLGYQPATPANQQPEPALPKRAYAKIPLSPIPPRGPSPVELMPRVQMPAGPLGPELPPLTTAPERERAEPVETTRPAEPMVFESSQAYGPPAPAAQENRFDLFAALGYATQHGRLYATQMEELYLGALDVTLQRHLFSTVPFAQTSVQYVGGQADIGYRSALTATANAGVRQRLPYGGEIVAQTLVQFVDALHGNVTDGESASVALSGSLPLLRGAGLVNLEGLISSERELVYRVRDFEDFRRSFAVDISTLYFRLLTLQQSVNNRVENYANLAALLERTRALFEAGRLNFLEVQRSEQALLSAENIVLSARESYQNALDDFKIRVGMPVVERLEVVPVELDVTVPDIESRDVIALAEQYRLDLQTARDRVDDARRQIAVSKNGLLPDLALSGQTQVGNRGGTPAKSFDTRSLNYTAGLTLDLPLDRLAERNVYRRSLIGFDRAQRGFVDLRDRIAADVRQAVRGIRVAESSLRIQRQSILLAQRRLDFANELLRKGTVNARDVVEAQGSLLAAQDAYDEARSDLQVQVLQFLRETGTLRVDPAAGAIGRALAGAASADAAPMPAGGKS